MGSKRDKRRRKERAKHRKELAKPISDVFSNEEIAQRIDTMKKASVATYDEAIITFEASEVFPEPLTYVIKSVNLTEPTTTTEAFTTIPPTESHD